MVEVRPRVGILLEVRIDGSEVREREKIALLVLHVDGSKFMLVGDFTRLIWCCTPVLFNRLLLM